VHVRADAVDEAHGAVKLQVRVENATAWPFGAGGSRDDAMRRSLLGAHTLLAVSDGQFVSLLDPPDWAVAAVAACRNEHTWPVLIGAAGERGVLLSSPIILYDYPGIAPESVGDLCDATEIDEILMLRVMTLSDEEKREACGTDERSRQIIERSDTIPDELFGRLHGAIRSLGPDAPAPARVVSPSVASRSVEERSAMERFLNGEEPAGPAVDAFTDVAGVRLSRGSRVTLRPKRRADAMDMFLEGRSARVEAIHQDVDGATYVAVTVEDDPAADLHAEYGRYFYFYPDEWSRSRRPGSSWRESATSSTWMTASGWKWRTGCSGARSPMV
jgi:hypothetical protein